MLAIHKDEARVVEGLHRILAARVLGHRVVTAKVMGGNESKRRIFGIRMGKSNLFYPSPTTFGRARPVPFPVDPRTNLSLSGPSLDKENITCQEARTGRLPGS